MEKLIYKINKFSASLVNHSEVVAAFIIISIVFMMILPLPTGLVDVLIAINICTSTLLIMLAMYLPGPLAFSTFPAVLLITTMFRLGLSISTTRLILLEGDAGNIVEAFGNFVVGGNFAVGIVIFLILTLVNFLVITKGSERVAEVSARFTLDAMPGKQMSIDSDLRANLITPQDAMKKRSAVGKESQLFGAMDGAMKFVKGDAIAGIIIVLVNLLGGFSIGVIQSGLPADESMKIYAILTIGDGLIAQIPALLISLTAGMMITRVAPDSSQAAEMNVGRDIAEQLLSQPKAWLISSIVMLVFAVIPGMPTGVFIVIAILVGFVGGKNLLLAYGNKKQDSVELTSPKLEEVDEYDVRQFSAISIFSISFNSSIEKNETIIRVIKIARRVRNRIVVKHGLTLPSIEINFDGDFDDSDFKFLVYEIPVISTRINIDKLLYVGEKDRLLSLGIDDTVIEHTPDYQDQYWIPSLNKNTLEENNLPFQTYEQYLISSFEEQFFKCASQFIGMQESSAILAWLGNELPELSKELQRVLPTAKFSTILQKLASERISLRSIRPISESLIEFAQQERDSDLLAEYIRIALKDQICHQFSKNGVINACLLTDETEMLLRESIRQTENGGFLSISPDQIEALRQQIKQYFSSARVVGEAILVAQDIRRFLRRLLETDFHHIPVLSFSELTSSVQINTMAYLQVPNESDNIYA